MKNKIINVSILTLCCVYALLRGRANKVKDKYKIILVSQSAKIGDMVCTTPMFRAVKRSYPEATLFVIGNTINKEVVRYNKDIDQYIEVENSILSLANNLRSKKIEFAAITSTDFTTLAACFLAGIPIIAVPKIENGWCPYETRPFKILRRLVVSVSHRMGNYAPREYLRLLETINIHTDDTKKFIFSSPEAESNIAKFMKENDVDVDKDFIVAISPSAGNKIKKWEESRFAAVADYIYQKYQAVIFIIGTKTDRGEVDAMIASLDPKTKYINACERFSLDELKAFMKYVRIFISVDTGPIYIAEACGVATIDIVGPMNEHEQPPISPTNRVVVNPKRPRPVISIMNARVYDYDEARRSIDGTTVDMVTTEFDSLYSQINK